MNTVENGDTLIDVKKRITDILSRNNIATSVYSTKTVRDTSNNDLTLGYRHRPIPIDNEIKLDPSRIAICNTDAEGVIQFTNSYYMEISGYQESELLGQLGNIFRHRDMPDLIYSKVTEQLRKGGRAYALVKSIAKDGSYYWAFTSYESKLDKTGKVISLNTQSKSVSENAISQIEKTYKTIKSIEDNRSLQIADKYFSNFLEAEETTYNQYIFDVLGIGEKGIGNYFTDKDIKAVQNKRRKLLNRFFAK